MNYETVIGLEVHVELKTQSKIFCSCTTAFGGDPNTQVCPVCLGMPGTLPLLNKQAVALALRAGAALQCAIDQNSRFDRKNYFYPDLPKAYQISQLYHPLCHDGVLTLKTGEKIRIREIHLEEDAGKLLHDPWEDATFIDYNRCGVALIEIVTMPDFSNGEQVVAFLESLREILIYAEISDCKMQEGAMRADINLSVKEQGASALGTRTEMKNMNSLKSIHRAIQAESQRQIGLLQAGEAIRQETRRWDDNKGVSFAMRSKEDAQDYRYFPEPDILPLHVSDDWLSEILETMPEPASSKRQRFMTDYGFTAYDSDLLTSEKTLCTLFEETVARCPYPREVANHIIVEIRKLINEHTLPLEEMKVTPQNLAQVIHMVVSGRINRTSAKEVLEELYLFGGDAETYVEQEGLLMVDDDAKIQEVLDALLNAAENQKSIQDYQGGKEKAFGYLVGQGMKALEGKAEPKKLRQMLEAALKSYNSPSKY